MRTSTRRLRVPVTVPPLPMLAPSPMLQNAYTFPSKRKAAMQAIGSFIAYQCTVVFVRTVLYLYLHNSANLSGIDIGLTLNVDYIFSLLR